MKDFNSVEDVNYQDYLALNDLMDMQAAIEDKRKGIFSSIGFFGLAVLSVFGVFFTKGVFSIFSILMAIGSFVGSVMSLMIAFSPITDREGALPDNEKIKKLKKQLKEYKKTHNWKKNFEILAQYAISARCHKDRAVYEEDQQRVQEPPKQEQPAQTKPHTSAHKPEEIDEDTNGNSYKIST